MNPWRLGIDLGSNSLGWAAVALDESGEPAGLMDWGVRIFPDGREPSSGTRVGESLAVARRLARGMRRNRDRGQYRVRYCAHLLADYGLAPAMDISPYKARHDAAVAKVEASVLGRALLHLCRRRGFLSNRKTDGEEKENSQRKVEMNILRGYLDQNRLTLGQFLYQREAAGCSLRFRPSPAITVDMDGVAHAVYPMRAMYREEFAAIRAVQGNAYLSDAQWDSLEQALFFQRPLKAQEPGRCTFEDAPRASSHLPLAQTFRIVQEVNNLRYNLNGTSHDLVQEQRERLYILLDGQREATFSSMRTKLKLPKDAYFNLESERRKGLKGNETASLMRSAFASYSSQWDELSFEAQQSVIRALLEADNQDDIIRANEREQWHFSEAVLAALGKVHFSSSFTRLSEVAMEKMLPLMRQGRQYWEAATEIYGGHTAERLETGEVLPQLPYYGAVLTKSVAPVRKGSAVNEDELQYGRIPNPSVHVALNQLRQVVNAVLARFGNPYEVHVELARDLKNNAKKRAEIEKNIARATKEKEENSKLLKACGIESPYADDLIKIRLWKELAEAPAVDGNGGMARIDIYTGRPISLRQCVSDEVEVEHILPYSRTYDDTIANKTITFRNVNREKGNRTPAEYLQAKGDTNYDAALQRAQHQLKASKRWRFQADALDIYERAALRQLSREEKENFFDGKDGAFIARQLKDTQYMARAAASYLAPVVGSIHRVVPVNGGVTALLRRKWQLGFAKQKGTDEERSDHRHHAVDALIVALTSRGMVRRIAVATQERQERTQDYRARLKVPMPDWLAHAQGGELREKYEGIRVSFRPEHSREGKFFEETAYGFLPEGDQARPTYTAVTRRALLALKETELDRVRDVPLRHALQALFASCAYAGLAWDKKLGKLSAEGILIGQKRQFIRSLRILVTNKSIRAIPSAPYKGYPADSYAFCDVWKVPETNKGNKFQGKFKFQATYVTYIDAKKFENNDRDLFIEYKPHPAATHCMRLFKNDMVLLTVEGRVQLMRVAGFAANANKIDLQPHTKTHGKQNHCSVNVCMENKMRKVRVTPDGRLINA